MLQPFVLNAQKLAVNSFGLKNILNAKAYSYNEWIEKAGSEKCQVVLQTEIFPDQKQVVLLSQQGIVLQRYLSAGKYIAVIDPAIAEKHVPQPYVYSIAEIKPEWKIESALAGQKERQGIMVKVITSFLDNISEAEIAGKIEEIGARILKSGLNITHVYYLEIPDDKIIVLAKWYATEYINALVEPVPSDAQDNTTQKTNIATLPSVYGGYGLTGNNVTVGIGDNTSGNFHVDIKDRCINYNPAPYGYHGVHTTGIVGGAGIVDVKGQGVAPGSILVNNIYSTIWEETPALYHAHNMTITNNSYAASVGKCDNAGRYDVYSVAVDRMALQYKDVLHVFAAGNDGGLTCSPFPPGFGTISGSYQPAKNNLVVASIDKKYENVKVTGSQGPVSDGRLKPEMSAVGADVYSSTNTDEYLSTLGTSMAAPQVAGALALLTERYKQLHANANPGADLMKTLILNGATDIGNPGPDFKNGFGALNLGRSLIILDSTFYRLQNISNSAQQTQTISVPAGTAQLKVMLYWHDEAASPLATKQLVNDLDLEVQAGVDIHKPLILDPTPANVNNVAVEGVDKLNNIEQVVIDNPPAGNYTLTIKGSVVTTAAQDYVLAYDFVPTGVKITYPTTGARVKNGDSLYIYWDASDDALAFTLEYSIDNGASWNTISNTIASAQRYYLWFVPDNINSGQCRMRLSRNATTQTSTTGAFVINQQPVVILNSVQCPGYIAVSWLGIPNTITYEVLRKVGAQMIPIDTITGTSYAFSGLSPDSLYYVAVSPILDGLAGYRSLAVKRTPKDGTCIGSISDGDLMIQSILNPSNGRQFTSTALSNNETLKVIVRNLDDAPVSNFRLSYSLDGGIWVSNAFATTIPPNDTIIVSLTGLDLSSTGDHIVKTAVENQSLSDGVRVNDTITKYISIVNNPPVDISSEYLDDFESMSAAQVIKDSFGMSAGRRWDYIASTDTGRLRSFVNEDITIAGNRSISMDAIQNMNGNKNDFTGTFNLAMYNLTDEIRMEFDYLLHGQPKFFDGNDVWVRGDDSKEWHKAYEYNNNPITVGRVQNSGSLSLTDVLSKNGEMFSTSTQIRFSQNDTSVISLANYGNGVTIDNVKLYTVKNDVQIVDIVSPVQTECGLTGEVPLIVRICNRVTQQQQNVGIAYKLDNGSVVTETIGSIEGKDTIEYVFMKKLNFNERGLKLISVWLTNIGDSYRKNDSILNYEIHNQPLISNYPYFQDFEQGDGYWYSEGLNNTWEYGTPSAPRINKPASGTKAWKTNLDATYDDLEKSYLYTPCFDLSKLYTPTLRFKMALDIEDCGNTICDAAFMEYSTDSKTWIKLGKASLGVNWYNNGIFDVWSKEDYTEWHVAETSLPKLNQPVRFRYVMQSDPGVSKEGLAIDDVNVFDKNIPGDENTIIKLSPNPTTDGRINIDWVANPQTEFRLSIMDMSGREVYRYGQTATDYSTTTSIQTPRFASGVYIMNIIIGEKHFEYKIVYL